MTHQSVQFVNTGPLASGYMSAKAFRRHAIRTFPFTHARPDDLDRSMMNLANELKIARDLMALALKRGDKKEVASRRRRIAQVQAAMRNGNALARKTGWPFKATTAVETNSVVMEAPKALECTKNTQQEDSQ